MKMLIKRKSFVFLLATLALMKVTPGLTETGRDFAAKAQQIHFNYDTLSVSAEMTIKRGGSTVGSRRMTVRLIENGLGKFDLGRIDIYAPSSIAGTVLLSWSNDKGDDQQWLRAANTNNTHRIGDRGRKATFVNSDFSFEDLLKWQVDSYTYEIVGHLKCLVGSCIQVRAKPIAHSSGYGHLLVDYDNSNRISQIQYFRKGSEQPWKALSVTDYRKIGNSWQPGISEMQDFESGSQTRIEWFGHIVGATLDATLFQPN